MEKSVQWPLVLWAMQCIAQTIAIYFDVHCLRVPSNLSSLSLLHITQAHYSFCKRQTIIHIPPGGRDTSTSFWPLPKSYQEIHNQHRQEESKGRFTGKKHRDQCLSFRDRVCLRLHFLVVFPESRQLVFSGFSADNWTDWTELYACLLKARLIADRF